MRKSIIAGLLLIVMAVATAWAGQPASDDYTVAVGDYFGVTKGQVLEAASKISTEELPVVCYIAERSKMSISDVVGLREKSEDWSQVVAECGLTSADMFVWGIGGASSTTYSPIVDKYKAKASKYWNEISLSDNEIVDLANLRFVQGHFGTNPQTVMSARDGSSNWNEVFTNVKKIALSQSKPAVATTK